MSSKTVTETSPLLPYLFQQWPEAKRTTVKQWLRFGAVHVNEQVITQHDHPLQPGDHISIQLKKPPAVVQPLPTGLGIIHEDEELLVVLKPAGLLTIATETERNKTAFRLMTTYLRESSGSAEDRLWIVHRLDRETSGLLVFAKSEEAKLWLQQNWTRMEKRYQAVVEGTMPAMQDTLTSYIDETQAHRVFATQRSSTATREAKTHYRVLSGGDHRSLLEITLETGRRHQIRVQLAAAGCPIVGDKIYGAKTNPIRRIALHATFLKLLHPSDQSELIFETPLPLEFARLVPVPSEETRQK